jgi:dihydroorotate dehydrogenase
MYSFIKKILFRLPPETAHKLTLISLDFVYRLGLLKLFFKPHASPCEVMGLTFQNRIGIAAGLDKNAEYIDALAALGVGFIEVGTVTPKPQKGNPKPRLFRLTKQEAIINRMGFNSKGVDYVIKQLEKINYKGILGINIGKNKETPNEQAIDDYVFCFRQLWPFASYITINISSPNTDRLRELQQKEALVPLLMALKQEQQRVFHANHKYVPLVVKVSPDLSQQDLHTLADILLEQKIDGVIATNTTTEHQGEQGGLSGRPLQDKSTAVVKQLHSLLQNQIPIIASGGIMDEKSADEKFAAGAVLLQLYTGLIYEGPGLISSLHCH